MNAKEAYERYRIMPALRLHQLRVAAVGKTVCEHFQESVDAETVVRACLIHDMGNIVKFDLTQLPEFLEPEGKAYWEGVQADFFERYGREQHAATRAIAHELGASEPVVRCIDAVAFSKAEATLESGSWEEKICEYADTRAAPHGILPLDERLREARARYVKRKENGKIDIALVPGDRFEELVEAEHEIERRIFAHADIAPAAITDASTKRLVEELWEYPVV